MSHPTISLEDIQDGFEKNLAGKLTEKQIWELMAYVNNSRNVGYTEIIQFVETLLKETLDLQRALIKKSE